MYVCIYIYIYIHVYIYIYICISFNMRYDISPRAAQQPVGAPAGYPLPPAPPARDL